MCCAVAPSQEAASKGRPSDPGLPVKGSLIEQLTDGVAPGFGLPIDSSFALAGEAVPLRVTETSLRRPPGFGDTPPCLPAPLPLCPSAFPFPLPAYLSLQGVLYIFGFY